MGKRNCRKCGKHIPNRVVIDGITKILRNRIFCFECSPYKKGNHNRFDPDQPQSGKEYKDYTPKRKKQITLSLYKRGLERKAILIEQKGGKCSKCGYNKSQRALCFHHENPEQKIMGLSLNNLWSKSWDSILEESKKCIVLCMNCHAELEQQISNDTNSYTQQVNEKYGTNFS